MFRRRNLPGGAFPSFTCTGAEWTTLKCNFVFSLWNMTKHIYQTLRKVQIEKMSLPSEFPIGMQQVRLGVLPLDCVAAEKMKRLLLYGGRSLFSRGDTPI